MWLLPDLPSFNQRCPDLAVRLIASDLEADLLAEDIDLAIVHGEGHWPGFSSELLFAEEVFPVCSPAYLTSAPAFTRPADLINHQLLHLESSHWDWMDWRQWCGLPTTDRWEELHDIR